MGLEEMERLMEKARRKERQREQFTLEHFRAAVQWNAVKEIRLRAEGSEFVLDAMTKDGRRMRLGMARGGRERRFRTAGTALAVLRELGLKEVMVDVEHYRPVRSPSWATKRPDMSLRLKMGHEAARDAVMEALRTPGVDKVSVLRGLMEIAGKK